MWLKEAVLVVISTLKNKQLWMEISVVKKRPFWAVISLVETGSFWAGSASN